MSVVCDSCGLGSHGVSLGRLSGEIYDPSLPSTCLVGDLVGNLTILRTGTIPIIGHSLLHCLQSRFELVRYIRHGSERQVLDA
jgi:hypothetical protein